MCGIAGWFSREILEKDEAQPVLGGMLDAIRHRGPDGEGREFRPHMALGHVRLSIIDLAGGAQPLVSCDNRALLSYNGEIYNYRELRAVLKNAGYRFHTESDSEVILGMYQVYGVEGFSRLRGMFAFALWDENAATGFLVRDLCGIKPLFYGRDGAGRVVFASEAKALIASGFIAPKLDEGQLHQVLNFRYLPGDGALFRGVRQVAPGEVLQWSAAGGLRKHSTLTRSVSGQESILDALRDSVHSHLVADVEVGVHLSGGIDSAAILALASEKSRLRTFTMDVGDDHMEAANAAKTADTFNVENLSESVNYNAHTLLPRMIWHMEMPKVNALQVYMLAGLSARHVKVVLSGMGGDELFYGYNAYRILWEYSRIHRMTGMFRSPGRFNGYKRSFLARRYEWNEYDRMRTMLRYGHSWPFIYGLVRNVWDCPVHREWIYGPRMLDSMSDDSFSTLAELWPQEEDPVAAARSFEWRNKLVNDLLWQEDRCTMAHGIESRVPFVDVLLEEKISRFTRRELMPYGKLKGRMREELSAILPTAVLNRKKSGFQVDSPAFFSRHLGELAKEQLGPDKVREHGLFNPEFVTFLLNLPVSRRYRWHYFMLYLMIGSHLWLELFEQGMSRPATDQRAGT